MPTESRGAEFVTVGWLLSALTSLVCEVAAMVVAFVAQRAAEPQNWELLAGLLTFSALVVGLASLALLPVVLKTRRVAPPLGVTAFAALVSSAPLVALVWRAWTH
jgi:hypothetical protein